MRILPGLRPLGVLYFLCALACSRKVPSPPAGLDAGPVAVAAPAAASDPAPRESVPLRRLPAGVVPLAYTLELTIDPGEERFSGTTRLEVELAQPMPGLWLHGKDLRVAQASFTPEGGAPIAATYAERHEDGIARVTFATPAPAGKGQLSLRYDAPFNRNDVGLARVREGGEVYAFTQFEAIDARRAFPSFDEPGWKTPFTVALTVKKEHVAIANTLPVGEEAVSPTHKRVRFARTEKLPTYLLAFAVGPLEVVDAPPVPPNTVRSRALPLRGVAVKGKGKRLARALGMAAGLLETLERYFGTAYPYDKLDLLAIPGTSGAMENAGAIVFEEESLLISEDSFSAAQARRVASGLSHEIAHHWFGNLVTMAWWDDLWLNEAFATWIGVRTHDEWRPAHRAWVKGWEWMADAITLDSLTTARQIRQPIESSHDIASAFDDITYGKGARVLGMFERYLGAQTFQKGVRAHLARFRFGTATADDFLASLRGASGKDVASSFKSFLDQPGIPLVEVTLSCQPAGPVVRFAQSRYLPRGSSGDSKRTWGIPICLRYPAGGTVKEQCTLLSAPTGELKLETADCPAWVHPNSDGAGYFRFLQEPRQQDALFAARERLTLREQLTLVDSLDAAYYSARRPAADILRALVPWAASPERVLAKAPLPLLLDIARRAAPPELQGAVEAFLRRLYAPAYARLGFEATGDVEGEERLYRKEVVALLALDAKAPAVRAEARRRGLAWLGDAGGATHARAVDPSLLTVALIVAAQEGGEPMLGKLLARLSQTRDAITRARLVRALAHITEPRLAARAREASLTPVMSASELQTFLREHSMERANQEAAWAWFQANAERVIAKLPPTPFGVGELPRRFADFCSLEKEAELERFFAPRIEKLPGGPRTLRIARETIRLCAATVAAQRESVRAFFSRIDPRTGAERP